MTTPVDDNKSRPHFVPFRDAWGRKMTKTRLLRPVKYTGYTANGSQ
jgi:hypothetical protein